MNGILGDLAGSVFDPIGKSLWQGTLILLRAALSLVGKLGRVDPTPGAGVISTGLWSSMLGLAAIVAVLLFFVQLTMAILAPRRNMLATITGPVQYAIATAISAAVVLALLAAADGLTEGILATTGIGGDLPGQLAGLGIADDVDGVKGMVLGVMGVVGILPLSIGYGITLLFRSAAIVVVFATVPVLSAMLVSLATKHAFHRGARWMLALIFLKPTFALCFAIGAGVVKTAGQGPEPGTPGGAAAAAAGGPQTGVVTLLLGLGIMFIALFAPFALFRLFAFVEPGTQPHQTMMSAFGSAVAGFKQAGQGIASADVGSVFSSATGGRFGGGAAGSSSPAGGPDGTSPSGGGAGGTDDKKQLAATAALAAATGGAGAAAGAAGGAGAGAAGGAAAGESAAGAGSASPGSLATTAGQGQQQGQQQGQDDDAQELAGAGAASPGQLTGAATGGAAGLSGSTSSSASSSGGGSGSGGAGGRGSAGSSGGASGGGYPSGSLAGVAAAAGSSVGGAVGSWGGGAVGAAGSAARSVGGGAWGAAQGVAGSGPMPPAPQGGVVGTVGDYGPSDYSGGAGFPAGGSAPNPYRDPSYDRPDDDEDGGYDGRYDHGPDDRGRMSGVL